MLKRDRHLEILNVKGIILKLSVCKQEQIFFWFWVNIKSSFTIIFENLKKKSFQLIFILFEFPSNLRVT